MIPEALEEAVAEALWEEARRRKMTVDDTLLAFGPWGGADDEERADFLALARAAIRVTSPVDATRTDLGQSHSTE